MKFSEARPGRIFVLRLEDGDVLHECVEQFALEQGVRAATLVAVGGADAGSRLVVGPADGRAAPIVPMEHLLDGVHEVAGVGTIFPDEQGRPTLHMHLAAGRQAQTVTGCVRRGVRVWHVLELVLQELVHTTALRRLDQATGFQLLDPG
ncbi:MAG: DNA-binding protein [Lentisphaerae bacterium]|nr:DNA-binding protein [Lentisphaerota bacterium]